ncbi:MAG TPA: Gfo/Idh/MocA family oxidoreductase [Lacunisphaera sp.]|jgi:predicted dehydrogenase|nr:Gfo/Idh/MocA family oxidoreductase [Lacunisphaera sp.]
MPSIAIVGYGYWGPKLVRNFLQHGGFSPVIIVEEDAARLRRGLRENPGTRGAASFAAVLQEPDVAAVVLATPVATHYPLARAALEAGKHVLVEKPLATTAVQAEELVALAAARKLVLGVDHTYVYHPAVQRIRELVRSGALGRLAYIDSSRINLGLFQHDVNVLWDLAVHDLAIVNTLVDERPATVQAIGVAHLAQNIENIGILVLRYASGLFVHINCSWVSPVKLRHMLIGGDRKMIVYDDLNGNEPVKIYDSGVVARSDEERNRLLYEYRAGDVFSPRIPQQEALANLVADFAHAVLTGGRPVSDGRFGADAVRVLEAAQHSVKNAGAQVALTWA